MGMFDKPKYLTGGDDAFAETGDTFWLHNGRIDGVVTINGATREQAKLLVSTTRDGDKEVVYTAGVAIVNAIRRMDASDRAAMPFEVRLDQVASKQGNPAYVLTSASEPTPVTADADTDIPF